MDETGESPLGELTFADRALIHALIQWDCVQKYGYVPEIFVKGAYGKGFLDLFDPVNNQFYEIKSDKSYDMNRHVARIKKYSVSTVQETRGNRYKFNRNNVSYTNYGSRVTPGTNKNIKGTVHYGIYDIEYYYQEAGIIVYKIKKNQTRATQVRYALGLALVTATIVVACPAAAPVAIPSLIHASAK